ncbi:MAG: hypothetical protein HY898_18305 [Deltaproteobacteria bacterium]|nr:hypothetical protein [Deltaproteobacteria bacterium]
MPRECVIVIALALTAVMCGRSVPPNSVNGDSSASAVVLEPQARHTAPSPVAASASASPEIASQVVSEPEPPKSGPRTCPSLPAARPADLVIGVARHILPHGGPIERYRAELSETQVACKANLADGAASTYRCVLATAAELDGLWADFRKRSFNKMRSQPAKGMSPHYGSRFIWLRWGGRYACEVGDSSHAPIEDASSRDFFELLTSVEDVGRKHI